MIEKVKEIFRLQKELEKNHGIIGLMDSPENGKKVHFYKVEQFLDLVISNDLDLELHNDGEFYRLSTKLDDLEIFILLDEKEYKEYKKIATDGTVTKLKDLITW